MLYVFNFLVLVFVPVTYGASIAVVEYAPIVDSNLTAHERINANTDQYLSLLNSIKDDNLGLIVYPEMTLNVGNTVSDSVETGIEVTAANPCDESDKYQDFVQKISCAAKKHKTFIVINAIEKSNCTNHPSDADITSYNCRNFGFFFFNTDFVFDSAGNIISTYRKFNLFGEFTKDKPSNAEIKTFVTDFNETFATFTCFDLLFQTPAQAAVELGIKNFVFPTMWFSELPLLTGLQAQQMFVQEHNVRFFSSGANNPELGSGGSAVFIGNQGMSVADIIADGGSKYLIYKWETNDELDYNLQTLEIDDLAKSMDNFYLKQEPTIKNFTSVLLDINRPSSATRVCHNSNFCCNFDIEISLNSSSRFTNNSYVYHLTAFQGVRSFDGVYNGGIEICALLACLNSSVTSCGLRLQNYSSISWPIVFENIQITADFEDSLNRTQFPNSLLSSIRPINASRTLWSREVLKEDGLVRRNFALKESEDRVLTFGIFGRNFDWDFEP